MSWTPRWFPHKRCQSAKHDGHRCSLKGLLCKMTGGHGTRYLALCSMHAKRFQLAGYIVEPVEDEHGDAC